jgi:hypothetical protein
MKLICGEESTEVLAGAERNIFREYCIKMSGHLSISKCLNKRNSAYRGE